MPGVLMPAADGGGVPGVLKPAAEGSRILLAGGAWLDPVHLDPPSIGQGPVLKAFS